jgi:hypothetical protein
MKGLIARPIANSRSSGVILLPAQAKRQVTLLRHAHGLVLTRAAAVFTLL